MSGGPPRVEELLARARAEVEAGRPWRARSKLRTWIAQFPFDPRLAQLLGEFEMEAGELPAAGRWLWLAGSTAEGHREAVATFLDRAGAEVLWNALPSRLRADPSWSPPDVVVQAFAERGVSLEAKRDWLQRGGADAGAGIGWLDALGLVAFLAVVGLGLWKAIELVGGLFS